MPRCFGTNGSRVQSVHKCLEGWGNSISMANFLFFLHRCPEKLRVDPQPERNKAITEGDSRMRHRKEPGLQTSGRVRLPRLA